MIFEFYPRLLKTEQVSGGVVAATLGNTLKVVNGKVVIGKTVDEQFVERNRAHLILTKPVPSPLTAPTISAQFLNPDGSLSFTPYFSGGVAPYSFEIEGDLSNGGFSFDPSTGTLSRPPQ